MLKWKKLSALFTAAAIACTAMTPCAMAASRTKVGKIRLSFYSPDVRVGWEGGTVEVTPSGDNTDLYYVDSVEIINEDDDWTSSSAPLVEVVLGVEDGENYYFGSSSSSGFKLSLDDRIEHRFDDIEFVDADREDENTTLILTVRLIFDEDRYGNLPAEPASPKWDETAAGLASWGDVTTAKYFEVQLIKNGAEIGDSHMVYDTSYDFSDEIQQYGDGVYTFKVRSVKASYNTKSGWSTSPSLNISGGQPALTMPGWVRAADGVRWWWQNADGTYPASQWMEIGGRWYYFDAQGYMATGWVQVDGVYYYLDTRSGAMYANRYTPDGYWVEADGTWRP